MKIITKEKEKREKKITRRRRRKRKGEERKKKSEIKMNKKEENDVVRLSRKFVLYGGIVVSAMFHSEKELSLCIYIYIFTSMNVLEVKAKSCFYIETAGSFSSEAFHCQLFWGIEKKRSTKGVLFVSL